MAAPPAGFGPLLAAMIESREQERTALSGFLHDQVGQLLSVVGLHLELLRMDLGRKHPEVELRTSQIQEALDKLIQQVRRLSQELHSNPVGKLGLAAALERLVERYRLLFAGTLAVKVDSTVRLPAPAAGALYRIAECALDNAVRHSRAGRIRIALTQEPGAATLEVVDNGTGFDLEEARRSPRGLGLFLMDHLAGRADCILSVTRAPRKGTIVRTRYNHLNKRARPARAGKPSRTSRPGR